MIESFWAPLKAAILEKSGHDGLVEFLSHAHATALVERGQALARERTSPDYQALTPHDLQTRVKLALKAPTGHSFWCASMQTRMTEALPPCNCGNGRIAVARCGDDPRAFVKMETHHE